MVFNLYDIAALFTEFSLSCIFPGSSPGIPRERESSHDLSRKVFPKVFLGIFGNMVNLYTIHIFSSKKSLFSGLNDRSGRKDNLTVNKWTRFDKHVCTIFFWSWMISRVLVDYTDIEKFIGHILDDVQAPHVSMNNNIRSITSYLHTSIVVHSGSNNYLRLRNLIHENMLPSSSKKQQNGKVSLKNGILGVDYKITINILMKHLYIAVR